MYLEFSMLHGKKRQNCLFNLVTIIHYFINVINYYDTQEAGMKGNNYFSVVFYTFPNGLQSVPSVVDTHSSISHIITQVRQ